MLPRPECVHAVKEDSVLLGKIRTGGRIVAVDGKDVQEMPAAEVTRLLAVT